MVQRGNGNAHPPPPAELFAQGVGRGTESQRISCGTCMDSRCEECQAQHQRGREKEKLRRGKGSQMAGAAVVGASTAPP